MAMRHGGRWDEAYPTDNAWNYRSWDHRGRRRLGAPAPTRPMPEVTPAYYSCWWSYWYKKCSNYCGANKYYAYYAQRYYRPRYRYNY